MSARGLGVSVGAVRLKSPLICGAGEHLMYQQGLRCDELNIGAPHGPEAARGAIVLERDSDRVRTIVARVRAAVGLPLWVKLTGQSEDVVGLARAAKEAGADAVTVMGRFLAFVPDIDTLAPMLGTNAAFGGPWALPLTCRWLAQCRKILGANFPLIGTNGARSGLDLARFLLAGATAVQVSSAVFTGGFGVVTQMLDEFSDYLDSKGVDAVDIIGRAADQLGTYAQQASRPEHWKSFVASEDLAAGLGEAARIRRIARCPTLLPGPLNPNALLNHAAEQRDGVCRGRDAHCLAPPAV